MACVLQWVAACCSVCVAACCSVVQCVLQCVVCCWGPPWHAAHDALTKKSHHCLCVMSTLHSLVCVLHTHTATHRSTLCVCDSMCFSYKMCFSYAYNTLGHTHTHTAALCESVIVCVSHIQCVSLKIQHSVCFSNTMCFSYKMCFSYGYNTLIICMCVAVCCRVLQCVAVCCSVLQCNAVCCSEYYMYVCVVSVWETYVRARTHAHRSTQWVCDSMCFSYKMCFLYSTDTKDSSTHTHMHTLATRCNALQHTATYCNALQHTATNCSTLQHMHIFSHTECCGVLQCVCMSVCIYARNFCMSVCVSMCPHANKNRSVVHGTS